jgi:hypothetical protein
MWGRRLWRHFEPSDYRLGRVSWMRSGRDRHEWEIKDKAKEEKGRKGEKG